MSLALVVATLEAAVFIVTACVEATVGASTFCGCYCSGMSCNLQKQTETCLRLIMCQEQGHVMGKGYSCT